MSDKWQTATLGDIACNISRPFDFKNINSVVFVNTGDVLSGEFLHENKVDAKGLPGQAKKAIEKGDILYSEIRPGNKRYVLISKDNVENFVVSTKFMVIKATGPVSPEYLYLILTSRECEEEFKVIADSRSGTFPQITFDSVSYYPVRFPSAKLQKTVVAIDGAITKKIQLNRQINQTLEQIAQALFKSWFVDFDPVKAKIEVLEAGGSEEEALLAAMQVISSKNAGELAAFEVEKPEEYAELRATAALFPAAMVESELGGIPEGWEVSQIGDEVVAVGGGTPSTKVPEYWEDGDISWTTPRDLSGLPDKVLIETDRKITESGLAKISSGLLPVNTVLMSSRAPVGYLALAKIPVAVNQGYIAIKCEKALTPEYVIQWCVANMDEIKNRASGTTFAEISRRGFRIIPVIVPTEDLLAAYSIRIKTIYEKIECNAKESKKLAELRDTLLPKLLSGEIDLSSVEK